jgi:glucokinase
MNTQWFESDIDYDRLILASDVGGTNTTLSLMAERDGHFTLLVKCAFQTRGVTSYAECVEATLAEAATRNTALRPSLCCISPAGPIEDNRCILTNVAWQLDGHAIEKRFGFKTRLINDFAAISYGLPLLDVHNPSQITELPHPDEGPVAQVGTVQSVVGAGTGLGVGCIHQVGKRYVVLASEGGHAGFAPFDTETRDLVNYLHRRIGDYLDAELFISGQGITNIYHYFKDVRHVPIEGPLAEIDALPDADKPPVISRHSNSDPVCRDIFRLFVKVYGRFAGDVASFFLSRKGLYLAGGIVTKNEQHFLEDHLFVRNFENCYCANIERVLKTIPVYIVKDYSVSLYGAANAICNMLDD